MRLFVSAAGTSTVPLSMTAVQTTAVLVSTSGFPVPLTFQQFSIVILDSGNPAWDPVNPLATPYEYAFVTGNNTGTNTLTFIRGQESTTGKAFFAGATISAVPLPTDFSASFGTKIDERIVSPAASSVRFPATGSLPTGYREYVVGYNARGDIAAQSNVPMWVRLNDDITGGNYAWQRVYGNAAALTVSEATSDDTGYAGFIAASTAIAGETGWGRITVVPNLTAARMGFRVDFNSWVTATFVTGQLAVGMISNAYFASGTPTSITVFVKSGNFIVNSAFWLYGIP